MSAGLIDWSQIVVVPLADTDQVAVGCEACDDWLGAPPVASLSLEALLAIASQHQLESHPEWGPRERGADRMWSP